MTRNVRSYDATEEEVETFTEGLQPTALPSEKFKFDGHTRMIDPYDATEEEVETFTEGLQPTALPSEKFKFDGHWRFCFQRGLSKFLHDRTKAASCSIINNEVLADLYIKLSGKALHTSDCATSAAPAETPGPCNC